MTRNQSLPKTILSASMLTAVLSPLPALANPASVPLSSAVENTQNLEVSGTVDHYLDFTNTPYQVVKAFSSDPQQFRALFLSAADNQQLILKWLPGASAKQVSVIVKLAGPGGSRSITFLVKRTDKVPKNILTAFTPQAPQAQRELTALVSEDDPVPRPDGPSYSGPIEKQELIRANFGEVPPVLDPPTPSQPITIRPIRVKVPKPEESKPVIPDQSLASVPQKDPRYGPKIFRVKRTPKPVQQVAKVSSTGRRLIDRSTLDNNALANYLIKGLHRAKGLRQINRNHKFYWQAQSTARLLRRGVSVQSALRRSHLPEKTFNDLLGHGGVSQLGTP